MSFKEKNHMQALIKVTKILKSYDRQTFKTAFF